MFKTNGKVEFNALLEDLRFSYRFYLVKEDVETEKGTICKGSIVRLTSVDGKLIANMWNSEKEKWQFHMNKDKTTGIEITTINNTLDFDAHFEQTEDFAVVEKAYRKEMRTVSDRVDDAYFKCYASLIACIGVPLMALLWCINTLVHKSNSIGQTVLLSILFCFVLLLSGVMCAKLLVPSIEKVLQAEKHELKLYKKLFSIFEDCKDGNSPVVSDATLVLKSPSPRALKDIGMHKLMVNNLELWVTDKNEEVNPIAEQQPLDQSEGQVKEK